MPPKVDNTKKVDAVSLDDIAPDKKKRPLKGGPLANIKVLIALFIIFVLVVSEVFTTHIVSGVRGAVNCRSPTSFGVVIQGIFVVIFYVLALYLINAGII
jgi:hypothetical protein